MSVLIKGMEMPKSCYDCRFSYDGKCFAVQPFKRFVYGDVTNFCPLIPVPDHGDLIDRDELTKRIEREENAMEMHGREFASCFLNSGQEPSTEWYFVEDMVDNIPVIIPAERSKDE